ncbi:MAG: hypothetical protein OEW05_09815, partial [Candidatus Aminicenantes bacterium]|nr:hypothetical protein [Candidatus Aminicenantes bacterium]
MNQLKPLRVLGIASSLAALVILFPVSRLPGQSQSSSAYADAAERLRRSGLQDEIAYELLRDLTAIGPRLTG